MARRRMKTDTPTISIPLDPPLDDVIKLETTKAILKYMVYSRGVFPILYDILLKTYHVNPTQVKSSRKQLNYLKNMIRLEACIDKASKHGILKVIIILGSNHRAPKQIIIITFPPSSIHHHHHDHSDHHHSDHDDDEMRKKKLRRRVGKVIESLIQWRGGDDDDDNNHNAGVHVMVKVQKEVEDDDDDDVDVSPEEDNDDDDDDDGDDDDDWSKPLCRGELLHMEEDFSLPKSGRKYKVNMMSHDLGDLSQSEPFNISGLKEIEGDDDDDDDDGGGSGGGGGDDGDGGCGGSDDDDGDSDDEDSDDDDGEFWYKCDVVLKGFK